MKTCPALLLAWAAATQLAFGAQLVAWRESQSPVGQVVALIEELKARVEADGKAEQATYSKYACWCEDTLGAKATDITNGKKNIESLQNLIEKLKGELGAHGADIKQLEKDIAANIESTKEATSMRAKEKATYQEEKLEGEQCIGALEAAIRVLAGSTSLSQKHVLETLQQAQLLSVAAGIRGILHTAAATHAVSETDLDVVRRFAERPEDFVGARASGAFLSAAQIANNPFGDYAPQSTRIQGILKSMYDSFTGDLEKANGEEAVKQKSHEELMATKKSELDTLQATLLQTQTDEATKTKKLADSKSAIDDAKSQLAADEEFFADTKDSCQTKASEWAERSRLRTEELHGMAKAIDILGSDGAKGTFHNASTTLLQLSARGLDSRRALVVRAARQLRALAARRGHGGPNLARIAAMLQAGGHFDKVIAAIDSMIAILRKEEADDISHRDRCEGSVTKNRNGQEDLNYTIGKSAKGIERMEGDASELTDKIGSLEGDINATKANIADLIQMRTKEHSDFVQAVKDDANAVELLNQAIVTLTKFYRSNGIPLELAEISSSRNGASAAPAEPETWSGGYGGRKGESGGIIAILTMIKEDLELETKTARSDDATAQGNFEKDRQAMTEMLRSQKASMTAAKSSLAALNMKVADAAAFVEMKGKDLAAAQEEQKALEVDCAWVASHFDTRRTKRKTEMDGLVEAKGYLAGVEAGTAIP